IERRRKHGIPIAARSRKESGDTSANWALTWHQPALTFDKRHMTNSHTRDVRDGIVRSGLAGKRNAQIPPARSNLCRGGDYGECRQQQSECHSHGIYSFRTSTRDAPSAFILGRLTSSQEAAPARSQGSTESCESARASILLRARMIARR